MFSQYFVVLKAFIVILFLAWFSVLDYKTRDIPDKYIWIWGFVSVALFIATLYLYRTILQLFIIYTILSIAIGPGLFGLLSYFELMGWADFFAILWITLTFPIPDLYQINIISFPSRFHFPPIIPIVLYSSLSVALIAIFRGIHTLAKYRKLLPPNISIRDKLALIFTGRVVSVKEYLSMRHYYPLTIPEVKGGKITYIVRRSFDIYEEYEDYQRKLKELLNKGLIKADDKIWVTYGIPFIVPLLLGFICTVIIGDAPILYVLFHI